MPKKKEKTITIKVTEDDFNEMIRHHRESRSGLSTLFECGDIMVSEMHGIDGLLYAIERIFDLEKVQDKWFTYERVVD